MTTWIAATALLACTDAQRTSEARADEVIAAMDRLDDETARIRDAVVQGDLAAARSAAGQVAERDLAVPGAPDGAAEQLRLALADVSGAATLADAEQGVAHVAAACAGCHSAMGVGGPDRPVWDVQARPKEMARHQMDLDRIWLALVRPSDDALKLAVGRLTDAAASPDATGVDARLRDVGAAVLSAASADRPDAFAALLAACVECHAPGPAPARPKLDGVALPPMGDEMSEHFVKALDLQLAVISGDPAAVHRAGTAIAVRPRDARYPEAADPYLDAIRAQALRAAGAPTMAEAGAAVGRIAVACGRCHTATGGGPKDALPAAPTEPPMAQHLYGAYWAIYGLQAPDERAWVAGTEALAKAPLLPAGEAPAGTEGLDAKVHDLAAKARQATDADDRAVALGDLLAACAPCHRAVSSKE
ncbi:MAG: hypothetical protein R3F59_23410 [Myxococcota bacterium]